MTAQIGMRLTLRSFKCENRKVANAMSSGQCITYHAWDRECYGLYTFWNVTSIACFPSSLDMTSMLARGLNTPTYTGKLQFHQSPTRQSDYTVTGQ